MADPTPILLAAIVAAAHTIETALGFGATVTALGAGTLLVPLPTLLPAIVTLGWLQAAYIIMRDSRFVAWRVLGLRVAPPVLLGAAASFLVRPLLTAMAAQLLLGALVTGIAVEQLGRAKATARAPSTPRAPSPSRGVLGVLAVQLPFVAGGLIHAILASGGPMIVAGLRGQELEPRVFRATLAVLWFGANSVLLATLDLAPAYELFPWLFPGAVAGLIIGGVLHEKLPAHVFQRAVSVLLAVIGVTVLARALGAAS